MHGTPYEQAVALSREGRFRDALQALSGAEMRVENVTLQTLRAELLEQTGAYAEAEQLAASLRRSRQLDRSLASRCEVVIGHIAQMTDRINEARERYRTAVSLAAANGDLEQVCWAQLRLLNTMRSSIDDPEVRLLLTDIRRSATRLGSKTFMCALHARVAAAEGERGALDSAMRHATMARSILAERPNQWLFTGLETILTVVDYARDDMAGAMVHATRALEFARVSGAAFDTACALSNLGYFYLLQGEYDLARSHLEEGLTLSPSGSASEIALTEGLARAYLLAGNQSACDALLSRLDGSTASWKERFPYHFRWAQPTLVRAALATNRTQEAVRLATRASRMAKEVSDERLECLILALWVDGLLSSGSGLVNGLLARALSIRDGSIELLGEMERVLGNALVQSGHTCDAISHFDRSTRAFASMGKAIGAPSMDRRGAESLDREQLCSNLVGSDDVIRPTSERLTSGLVALNLLSHNVEMHGLEALKLFAATHCAVGASLDYTDASGRYVVESWGQAHESPPEMESDESDCTLNIELGETRKGRFRLLARSRRDLPSIITFQNLKSMVRASIELRTLRAEHGRAVALWPLEDQSPSDDELPGIFAGEKIRELLGVVRRTASMHINVLITGETGTGKELVARLIHQWSPRAKQPFVPFNCSAVPRDMLDAQLFGHKRGAFTGAVDSFQGIIRGAGGGTLFLDEIGEIAVELQPKLLRFLESAEVHPIGEARPSRVDVRVVAATNADLDQLAREKRFREDLLYRLNVLQIRMPPLRERRDEIPLLARYFLERHSIELGRSDVGISGEALEFLALRDWPGNIRELSNTMRRAVALAREGAVLMPEHVCSQIDSVRSSKLADSAPQPQISVGLEQPLVSAFQQIERAMILHAIRRTGGQMEEAARLLGLSRKGLYLKRQRLCVEI